jgi:hypothetical protein
MRRHFSEYLEAGRILAPSEMASRRGERNGAFRLRCPVTGALLAIICSDGAHWLEERLPGPAWEHVSVSHKSRVPNHTELCWVKRQFFEDLETVVHFYPPEPEYVNVHPNVLHLWRPVTVELPRPPRACV